MSEAAAPVEPGYPDRPAVGPSASADLTAWLASIPANLPVPPADRVDLFTLVSQFTALRHEVNLQTKAARAAVEALQTPAPDPDRVARPLVKALLDVADALRLGTLEVQAALDRLQMPPPPPPSERGPGRLLKRWFGPREAPPPSPREPVLAGIATGYELAVARLDRALEAAGVEGLVVLGGEFDPDEMEAVSTAAGPPGKVVAEVRRGYRWRGELIRPALVTVGR